MANFDELSKIVADHEQRSKQLEGKHIQPNSRTRKSSNSKEKTLPELIIELRDSGFFSTPRTTTEVQQKLKTTYPCEPDRITMALFRLFTTKQLRKTSKVGNKQRINAYVR
jgi:hypothetical protein